MGSLHGAIEALDEGFQDVRRRPPACGQQYLAVDDGHGELVLGAGQGQTHVTFSAERGPLSEQREDLFEALRIECLGIVCRRGRWELSWRNE